MFLSGIFESITIKLVIPLLSNLINPEKVTSNFFNENIIFFNSSVSELKILNSIIIFSLIIAFATFLKLLTLWFNERFAAAIGNDVSKKSFSVALRLPYLEHISRNSSEIITIMIKYVDDTVNALKMFLKATYYSIISFFIVIGLFSLNFYISIISILTLTILYFLISTSSKKVLINNGKNITLSYSNQTKYVQESLGAIRDIILNRSYEIFENKFEKQDFIKRRAVGLNVFLAAYPKILLEGCGIIFVALLGYSLNILYPNNAGENLGLIAAFALGCQKLLPAIQSIYISLSRFRTGRASLLQVINLINSRANKYFQNYKNKNEVFKSIELINVSFKYKGSKNWIIKTFNIKINKGEKIGIIGETGCGKSTLIDLIIGLLEPSKGIIRYNNIDINYGNNEGLLESMHKIISYVPQSIFITDNSIIENIAFGIPKENIDLKRVKYCASIANIHDYIITTSKGYKTILGERGIKLSGGQIQRIGIARALYKEPNILIFDESTSALDTKTERKVIQSISSLNEEMTIIFITHRLKTISNCNKVFEIENGNVKNIYTNEEIDKRIKDG
jgi:ATP-binding cassette subfamily B protein